ncbi:DUF3306 domain-containing protein [Shewanella sp. SW36]|uniref:DUF3306 domain-containing protein n=1 Tax=Shewanella TaxID=22 RepID=UPI0021DAB99E|nr:MULTISPECIES: DUF3306 domain-containing protein [unclassified Shewanella]MCU7976857.1 DUF3306 domain-containing protein [Shewanella sp. SW36]MCU7992097.1 DUF3306 domain-containing protein [Shewanella sp. SW1]MCU8014666.1 DUF3306 domain-containing protein [Shewanella sp. SM74]MCU8018748.1 DUF3306 domain-containing protein [Shewanella sp. SM72]MCU8053477.1 DUF3306 domain-containing protein [Shewanella sp. SM43]
MAESIQKTGGLLSRWNQRREQVAAEEARADGEITPQETIVTEPTMAVEQLQPTESAIEPNTAEHDDPNRMLTAADLPNPDEIEIGGSFASFMGANVDPAAKSAALRALWKQPHFNEIDGLLEYALDYSNQPKLSAEVSAELAQKVFRYITKDSETPDEELTLAKQAAETNPSASLDVSETTTQAVDTELAAEPIADNLDGEIDDLPQNAPEPSAQVQTRVV